MAFFRPYKRRMCIAAAVVIVVVVCMIVVLKGDREERFEIAYSGLTCGSPIAIAKLKGFYEAAGVNVELVSGTAFEAQQAALAAGRMPVINGDFQFFPAIENGFDIKIISGLHEGCIKIIVPENSTIRDIQDLKGKTVLVDAIGGTPMMVTAVAAGRVGLDPGITGDIVWKPFPWDQLVQALDKGEGDVAALWDPFATMAENSGKYRVILDIAKDPVFAGRNCCFLFASGKLISENPKAVAAVLQAILKGVEWTGEHPAEAAALLVEQKKIATDDTAFITELLESYRYHNHHWLPSIAAAKDDALYFAMELKKIGYLSPNLDVESFVDSMFVDVFSIVQAENHKP